MCIYKKVTTALTLLLGLFPALQHGVTTCRAAPCLCKSQRSPCKLPSGWSEVRVRHAEWRHPLKVSLTWFGFCLYQILGPLFGKLGTFLRLHSFWNPLLTYLKSYLGGFAWDHICQYILLNSIKMLGQCYYCFYVTGREEILWLTIGWQWSECFLSYALWESPKAS